VSGSSRLEDETMKDENTFFIPYGTGFLEAKLPQRTRIIRQATPPIPALNNVEEAIRGALKNPIEHEPLSKLVGPKSVVTIGFDDPIGFCPVQRQPDFRAVAVKVLLQELDRLGVDQGNIRLVCAVGLHRKWTTRELSTILGEDIGYRWGPSSLFNHDAEDEKNLRFLGETKRRMEVEVNRLVVDSDQFIYVSNPWSHFNGGWKSAVVGLSSFRSIRYHHRPYPKARGKSTMDPERSAFPKLLNEMGAVIEKELARRGRRYFQIEAAMNNEIPQAVVQVVAGHPPEAHEKTLQILQKQHVETVNGQSDVVVYGMGNSRDPYSKMSQINPILVRNLGMSYSFGLFQNRPLVREKGIIILVHPCIRTFDRVKYPSYIDMFERLLPHLRDPFELWELYAEEFAHRPEYVHRYRYGFGFHGVHPFILYGQGAYGFRYLSRVFLAGAKDFETARIVGFEPFETVEEAVEEAERTLGKDCSITYPEMEQSYICNVE
jgi:nickel-dependent lactate racemase